MHARIVGLTLLCIASLACTKAAPSTQLREGPLDLTLPSYPDRSSFTLSSRKGRVVLLDVWATWCEPCRESLPKYQALAAKHGGKGLDVVTINVDGEAAVPKAIPTFVTETKLSLPILLDTDAKLSEEQLRVKVMPTAFLVDRKGVVRHVHEGFEGETFDQLERQLEGLLAEP